MAHADTNWSHWEGWYSSVSPADAAGRTSNAECFICPGLPKMYVQGGSGGVGVADQNLVYNPTSNSWSTALTVIPFETEGGAGFTDATSIWQVDNTDGATEEYTISTDSWSSASSMSLARKLAATSDNHNGFGILSHGGDPSTAQDDARKLTFSTGVWSSETTDTGNDRNSVAGFSDGSNHWAVGSSVTDLDGSRKYSISGTSWSAGPNMSGDRYHANACTSHFTGIAYVAKGNDGVSTLATMEKITLATSAVSTTSAGTDARQHPMASALDRDIFTSGGDSGGARSDLEAYNQPGDSWTNKASQSRASLMSRGAPNDQHVQHHSISATSFTIEGLTHSTPYFVALWSHDTFGNVQSY